MRLGVDSSYDLGDYSTEAKKLGEARRAGNTPQLLLGANDFH